VEPTILSLHVEDEVDETGRPFTQAAITRIAVEIEKEHNGTRCVVDAGDAFKAPVARHETGVFVVCVHAQGDGARPGRGNAASQPRELPDHRGHGSRLARMSLTEKSAAAMTESAAP